MSAETIERTFAVGDTARLRLKNISGSVTILPGQAGSIHVLARKDMDSKAYDRTEIIMDQSEDGQVLVETRLTSIFNILRPDESCDVDYEVHLPAHCSVDVSTVSASCSIRDLQGEIRVATVSGGQSLSRLSGRLRLKTVSGDIRADSLVGELDFDSVSGDLDLPDARLERIEGKTVSGDLEIETALFEGPYQVGSVSGDLTLRLPVGQNVQLRISSISGSIRVPGRTSRSQSPGRRSEVALGQGGPVFRFKSISGDLAVQTDGSFPENHVQAPYSASHTDAPRAEVDPLEVLQAIEDGELTVQEGLERLQALD
jgi:hypothetical protein